jgi:hypothetical protein
MMRNLVLALGVALAFGATCLVMIRFMPQPLKDSDLMLIGSVATLVSLLALFLGLSLNRRDTFFTRRTKR